MLTKDPIVMALRVGQRVRVQRSFRSPYPGRCGVIIGIYLGDNYGTHLVSFDDGVQFRYTEDELRALPDPFGLPVGRQFAS
jgi:hypothetical protein